MTALARLSGASTGRGAAHRPVPGAGRRVRLRAADAGAAPGLVPPALLNPILASMVLSMLATPFIILYSNRIVMKLVASDWLLQSLQMTTIARKSINTSKPRDHLRLRPLRPEPGAHAGAARHIPYMALDLDPDRVRQAAAAGDSVVFGDAARLQALMAAGLARASAVVVTYLDVPGALKVLASVRAHAPQVPVIVRTPGRPRPGEAARRRRHRGGARGASKAR